MPPIYFSAAVGGPLTCTASFAGEGFGVGVACHASQRAIILWPSLEANLSPGGHYILEGRTDHEV